MMNIKCIIILASLCFYACLAAREPDYEEISDKIVAKVVNIISKKYHMEPTSIYGELFERVNAVGANFQINRPLTKDEARQIIVDCAEIFLTQYNNNLKVRPFLKNYPFTKTNLKINIFIQDKKGNTIYHPEIGMVSLFLDNVVYTTLEKGKVFDDYKTKTKEPYEEAFNIVKTGNKI